MEEPPQGVFPTVDARDKKLKSRLVAVCYPTCFGPTTPTRLQGCLWTYGF